MKTRILLFLALAAPALHLFRAGELIGANNDWAAGGVAQVAAIEAATAQVGAFALASGSRDAALLVALPAGHYTVHLSGPVGDIGTALLEVYLVP